LIKAWAVGPVLSVPGYRARTVRKILGSGAAVEVKTRSELLQNETSK
jgi:hypothetical protein